MNTPLTGAMIAFKLAAVAPERLSSLALLNVTGGGYECLPKAIIPITAFCTAFPK